jgi:hypothetical protein
VLKASCQRDHEGDHSSLRGPRFGEREATRFDTVCQATWWPRWRPCLEREDGLLVTCIEIFGVWTCWENYVFGWNEEMGLLLPEKLFHSRIYSWLHLDRSFSTATTVLLGMNSVEETANWYNCAIDRTMIFCVSSFRPSPSLPVEPNF